MSEELTTVVWREWFNEATIAQLTAMGTLPRNETLLDCRLLNGADVAAAIAEDANGGDNEAFREGGELTIIEPEEFAGDYEISIDYEPFFFAHEK